LLEPFARGDTGSTGDRGLVGGWDLDREQGGAPECRASLWDRVVVEDRGHQSLFPLSLVWVPNPQTALFFFLEEREYR
jgi:hypothetical protein